MKKTIILIAALLLATGILHAQTGKGNQTIGLDLGFSYNKGSQFNVYPNNNAQTFDSKTTHFSFGPAYSYFIADKLDLGANFLFDVTDSKNASTNQGYPANQSTHSYGGAIYLRKYLMHKDKIGIRTGPYAGYMRSNSKATYNGINSIYDQDGKTDNYYAGLRAELVYFPSKNLGFSTNLASLSYDHAKIDNGANGHSEFDSVMLNFINTSLSLSVFYVFGNK
jgi:hypothetical protein